MLKRWFACIGLMITGSIASPHLRAQSQQTAGQALRGKPFSAAELKAFQSLHPIDAHTHIYAYTPEYLALLAKLQMHTLDIMVVSDNANQERKDLAKESRDVFNLVHLSKGAVYACTTFDAYRFNDPDFVKKALAGLDAAYAEGALAVKVWKNVGLEVKNGKGNYILPDDPALQPIYQDIAKHGKTLITHIADPDTAFLPPNPNATDQAYYLEHPEWYMYKIAGSPTKDQILTARDHVLRDHPDLRMVGAHLGSMEADLHRLGVTLDRYPNFAVDLTARMPYLMKLPRAEAIAFFTKYQDRLIYGTDETLYPGDDVQRFLAGAEDAYARDWRFLSGDAPMLVREIRTQGLALPRPILQKVFHRNAVRWYPGLQ